MALNLSPRQPVATPTQPTNSDDFLNSIIPGFAQNAGKASSNISSLLSGQVPQDVTNNIQNQSAAWGFNSGMPGFQGGTLTSQQALKNLGLTSLQEQQTGQGNLLNMISGISSPTLQNQGQQLQNNQFEQSLNQNQNQFNVSQQNQQNAQLYQLLASLAR